MGAQRKEGGALPGTVGTGIRKKFIWALKDGAGRGRASQAEGIASTN